MDPILHYRLFADGQNFFFSVVWEKACDTIDRYLYLIEAFSRSIDRIRHIVLAKLFTQSVSQRKSETDQKKPDQQ
jgi:NADH:ubiquinone oxidoreductase subunit D